MEEKDFNQIMPAQSSEDVSSVSESPASSETESSGFISLDDVNEGLVYLYPEKARKLEETKLKEERSRLLSGIIDSDIPELARRERLAGEAAKSFISERAKRGNAPLSESEYMSQVKALSGIFMDSPDFDKVFSTLNQKEQMLSDVQRLDMFNGWLDNAKNLALISEKPENVKLLSAYQNTANIIYNNTVGAVNRTIIGGKYIGGASHALYQYNLAMASHYGIYTNDLLRDIDWNDPESVASLRLDRDAYDDEEPVAVLPDKTPEDLAFEKEQLDKLNRENERLNKEAADSIREAMRYVEDHGGVEGFISNTIGTISHLGMQMAVGMVGGGLLSTAFMGSQIMAGDYLDARLNGASHDRALRAAGIDALIQTPMEQLALGKLLNTGRALRASRGGLASFYKALVGNSLTESPASYVTRNLLESVITEYTTEVFQGIPEKLSQLYTSNDAIVNNWTMAQSWQNLDVKDTLLESMKDNLTIIPATMILGLIPMASNRKLAAKSLYNVNMLKAVSEMRSQVRNGNGSSILNDASRYAIDIENFGNPHMQPLDLVKAAAIRDLTEQYSGNSLIGKGMRELIDTARSKSSGQDVSYDSKASEILSMTSAEQVESAYPGSIQNGAKIAYDMGFDGNFELNLKNGESLIFDIDKVIDSGILDDADSGNVYGEILLRGIGTGDAPSLSMISAIYEDDVKNSKNVNDVIAKWLNYSAGINGITSEAMKQFEGSGISNREKGYVSKLLSYYLTTKVTSESATLDDALKSVSNIDISKISDMKEAMDVFKSRVNAETDILKRIMPENTDEAEFASIRDAVYDARMKYGPMDFVEALSKSDKYNYLTEGFLRDDDGNIRHFHSITFDDGKTEIYTNLTKAESRWIENQGKASPVVTSVLHAGKLIPEADFDSLKQMNPEAENLYDGVILPDGEIKLFRTDSLIPVSNNSLFFAKDTSKAKSLWSEGVYKDLTDRGLIPASRKKLIDDEVRKKIGSAKENIATWYMRYPPAREVAHFALTGMAGMNWYEKSKKAIDAIFGEDAPFVTYLLAGLSPHQSVESSVVQMLDILRLTKDWEKTHKKGDITPRDVMKFIRDTFGYSENRVPSLLIEDWKNKGLLVYNDFKEEHTKKGKNNEETVFYNTFRDFAFTEEGIERIINEVKVPDVVESKGNKEITTKTELKKSRIKGRLSVKTTTIVKKTDKNGNVTETSETSSRTLKPRETLSYLFSLDKDIPLRDDRFLNDIQYIDLKEKGNKIELKEAPHINLKDNFTVKKGNVITADIKADSGKYSSYVLGSAQYNWVLGVLKAIMSRNGYEVDLNGEKVLSFQKNLNGASDLVTNDTHMIQYFFGKDLTLSFEQYVSMEAVVTEATKELNEMMKNMGVKSVQWTPMNVQAAIWCTRKKVSEIVKGDDKSSIKLYNKYAQNKGYGEENRTTERVFEWLFENPSIANQILTNVSDFSYILLQPDYLKKIGECGYDVKEESVEEVRKAVESVGNGQSVGLSVVNGAVFGGRIPGASGAGLGNLGGGSVQESVGKGTAGAWSLHEEVRASTEAYIRRIASRLASEGDSGEVRSEDSGRRGNDSEGLSRYLYKAQNPKNSGILRKRSRRSNVLDVLGDVSESRKTTTFWRFVERAESYNDEVINGEKVSARKFVFTQRTRDFAERILREKTKNYDKTKDIDLGLVDVYELNTDTPESREISSRVFFNAISEGVKHNKWSACVQVKAPEIYKDAKYRLFLTKDGLGGFAIDTVNMSIVSAFSNGKNYVNSLMPVAISCGGLCCDCFDTRLPDLYSKFGFRAVSRTTFNDEYQPMPVREGPLEWQNHNDTAWNKETYKEFNNGSPDVVFMVFMPWIDISGSRFGEMLDSYDSAEEIQQSYVDKVIDSYNEYVMKGFEGKKCEFVGLPENLADSTFKQEADDSVRGFFTKSGNKSLIRVLEGYDISTLFHEMSHYMLEDLIGLMRLKPEFMEEAQREAWNRKKADFDALMKNAGLSDISQLNDEDTLRRFHEITARQFEAYLLEGGSANPLVSDYFSKASEEMKDIYRSVEGISRESMAQNGVGIGATSVEVREVFDRLFAIDEQFLLAKNRGRLSGVFEALRKRAESLGIEMPVFTLPDEDKKKSELSAESLRGLYEANELWKEVKEDVRDAVEFEVSRIPAYQLLETIGDAGFLPLSSDIPTRLVSDHGVNPFETAHLFGFRDVKDMISTLERSKPKDEFINEIMTSKYLQFVNSANGYSRESLQNAVNSIIHSRETLYELAKASNWMDESGKFIDADELYARAVKEAETKRESDIILNLAMEDERRAADEFIRLTDEGEHEKALEAYKRYVALFAKSTAAFRAVLKMDEAKLAINEMTRAFDSGFIDGNLEGYSHAADILEKFGNSVDFPESKTLLRDYASERKGYGDVLDIASWIENGDKPDSQREFSLFQKKRMKDLTSKEQEEVANAVKSLIASSEKASFNFSQNRDNDEIANELINQLKVLFNADDELRLNEKRSRIERFSKSKIIAEHRKMEFVLEQLDGWRREKTDNGLIPVHGLFWNAFFKPFYDAQNAELDKFSGYSDILKNAFTETFQKGELASRIPVNEGRISDISMSEMISVALNSGTLENKEHLCANYTPSEQEAILSHMTQKHWDFVKTVWGIFDEISEEERSIYKELGNIEKTPKNRLRITTSDGTVVEGGEYPIVTISRELGGVDLEERGLYDPSKEDVFSKLWQFTSSKDAHGEVAPLVLNLYILRSQISRYVHDLCYRKAVHDVKGLWDNPNLRRAVANAVGEETMELFTPWIEDIKNNTGSPKNELANEKIANKLRNNITVMTLGWNVFSGIMQHLSIFQSASEMGLIPMLNSYMKFWGNTFRSLGPESMHWSSYDDMVEEVYSKSNEMKYRSESFDRELASLLESYENDAFIRNIGDTKKAVLDSFGALMTWFDRNTCLAIWTNAYEKDLKAFGDEAHAIEFADSVIRKTQPSSFIKDKATMLRNQNSVMKMFTMFYTAYSNTFNLLDRSMRFRSPDEYGILNRPDMKRSMQELFYAWIIPAFASNLVSLARGRSPDEPEDWWKWIAINVGLYPLQAFIPTRIFGSALNSAMNARFTGGWDSGVSMTPLERAFEIPMNLMKLIMRRNKKGEEGIGDRYLDRKFWKDVVSVTGLVFGFPSNALNKFVWNSYDAWFVSQMKLSKDIPNVNMGLLKSELKKLYPTKSSKNKRRGGRTSIVDNGNDEGQNKARKAADIVAPYFGKLLGKNGGNFDKSWNEFVKIIAPSKSYGGEIASSPLSPFGWGSVLNIFR